MRERGLGERRAWRGNGARTVGISALLFALSVGCGSAVQPKPDAGDAPRDAGGRDAAGSDAAGSDGATPTDASEPTDAALDDAGPEPALVRSTDFAEDPAEVRNPDRGFYWWDWNDAASLVLVQGLLTEQCGTAVLPPSVSSELRARLDAHRAAGRRVILRFLYADDGLLNPCGLADAESIELVEGHIAQLASLLHDYVDVIAFVEAGFLGMWGEWNAEFAPPGTSLSASADNRRRTLRALLDAVPPERAILVRRPRFRDELPFTAAELARIGFHDDCLFADASDAGTYDGARSIAEWKSYIRTATAAVPLGGETCADTPAYTNCANALTELAALRYTYVHEGYSPEVIARWDAEGCLPELRRRLGYRIVVRAVEAPLSVLPSGVLRVRLEIENVGFAPPYSTRRLRLVLRRGAESRSLVPFESLGADTRAWAPGAPLAVELAARLPAGLASGAWEVRVAVLEDTSDAPAYALVFANDARVRDDALRENVVASVVVP